ncbi:unnamed protein product [Nesidiocoris tenuis]|uniref:tRNA selenocysteine-associated protein 1 n=1 Tax=Nesidiocoris tenuis TaxID=355587 RepID=A0A6H5HAC6_9HEMI|nr:unnamed protein product [Nesidiocoris tenuis]
MAAGSMVHCQLWMGGLEPYMTESFILASFERMGEKPLNVKVMRNKFTGEPAGYCFVHFENDDEAIDAMHKLNGKVIPNTNPPVRFRLNTATNQGKIMMGDREFSLWVGDLSPEVDDYTLYKTFAGKYQSLRAAKVLCVKYALLVSVILDHSGYSKGFGFLRFGSEDEQKHCLNHMNGYKNLGSKPIKISNAIPKTQRNSTSNGGQQQSQQSGGYQYPQDYSHYYDPNSYWQNYSQWGGYGYDPNTGYSYDPSSYAAAQQYGSTYQTQYGQYPPSSATGYSQQGGYGSYSGGPYSSYYPQPQGGTTAPPPSSMTSNSGTQPAHGSVSSAAVVDEANEIVGKSPATILNFWFFFLSKIPFYGSTAVLFPEEVDSLPLCEAQLAF